MRGTWMKVRGRGVLCCGHRRAHGRVRARVPMQVCAHWVPARNALPCMHVCVCVRAHEWDKVQGKQESGCTRTLRMQPIPADWQFGAHCL